jgi:hypothetical protein
MLLVGNSSESNPQFSIRFGRVFDSNLTATSNRFTIGSSFVLSGDTEPVGGKWLASWAWKPTHDSPRAGIAYAFISLEGVVSPETFLTDTYPDNGIPTVVSNGGATATEAMIIFRQIRNVLTPQITNEDALRGQRLTAGGDRIGSIVTLIDQPQVQDQVRAVFDGTNYLLSWTDQRNYPYPAQGQDDVFAARVKPDGTALDPTGFVVAASSRPEYSSSLGVAGGNVLFMYRSFRPESPLASYRLARRVMSPANGLRRVFFSDRRLDDTTAYLSSRPTPLTNLTPDILQPRIETAAQGSTTRLIDEVML